MYKLLIVDDEELDREGLKFQIPWDKYGIDLIEPARSGFDACRKSDTLKPDILITDIKMPGMNGLVLAENLKHTLPNLKVIFVSGFDDFEFVKSALRLEAFEYILKPVDTLELENAIIRVVDSIRLEESRRVEEQELRELADDSRDIMRAKLLSDLIYGVFHQHDEVRINRFLPGFLKCTGYYTLLVELDDYRLIRDEAGDEKATQLFGRAHDYVTSFTSDICKSEILAMTPSRYIVILLFNQIREKEKISLTVNDYASEMMKGIRSGTGLSATISLGLYVESIYDIYLSYNLSCEIMSRKMLKGKGTILASLQENTGEFETERLFHEIDKELTLCVRSLDYDHVERLLDYLFDRLEEIKPSENKYVHDICIHIVSRLQIMLYEMNETAENIFGKGIVLWEKLLKFETILDIRHFMRNIFKSVIEYLDKKNSKGTRKIIEKVMQYINGNYHTDISLKEISSSLFYSPNYLGLIIKEELGKGFNEYLAEFRMKKAAELLKDPTLKVYEIAEKVSYRNVTAFVNKFKEYYGITPREFRERA